MDFSINLLERYLSYDLERGKLFWKPRPESEFTNSFSHKMWSKRFSGKEIVAKNESGYITVRINRQSMPAHRAMWILAHGKIPDGLFIDHINHIRHDNRISNLRVVTHIQNQKNLSMNSRNTSGVNGVRYDKKSGKWLASLCHKDKTYFLGSFKTLDEAKNVRLSADDRFGFHDNHGEDKYLRQVYIDPWNAV
ncbi:HNH endonuclease signature motif containing protein [Vibrio algivorus]|uniref:HNH endonuclease signature motif containing protein n=1 Tax=Vibrio algivorus TaxID=1667024 RepID=UPI00164257BE|nr:HNH endonuclease signature motif containing protein [Vibrio algivorus]